MAEGQVQSTETQQKDTMDVWQQLEAGNQERAQERVKDTQDVRKGGGVARTVSQTVQKTIQLGAKAAVKGATQAGKEVGKTVAKVATKGVSAVPVLGAIFAAVDISLTAIDIAMAVKAESERDTGSAVMTGLKGLLSLAQTSYNRVDSLASNNSNVSTSNTGSQPESRDSGQQDEQPAVATE